MADIGNEIDAIRAAKIGEEVRGKIADALEKMNVETNNAEKWATGAGTVDPGGGDMPGTENNAKAYAEAAEASVETLKAIGVTFHDLPTGYSEKYYIETTGDAMVDTGIGWKNGVRTIIDVLSTGGYFFGVWYNNSTRYLGSMNGAFRYADMAVATSSQTSSYVGKRVLVDFGTTALKFDNVTIATYDASSKTGRDDSVRLFGEKYVGTGSGQNAYANEGTRIYRAKIISLSGGEETLRFDGIPCVRDADNAIGFYDLVTNTFKGAETGTLTYGNYANVVAMDARITNIEDVIASADAAPTEDSEELVKSGGVYTAVNDVKKVADENAGLIRHEMDTTRIEKDIYSARILNLGTYNTETGESESSSVNGRCALPNPYCTVEYTENDYKIRLYYYGPDNTFIGSPEKYYTRVNPLTENEMQDPNVETVRLSLVAWDSQNDKPSDAPPTLTQEDCDGMRQYLIISTYYTAKEYMELLQTEVEQINGGERGFVYNYNLAKASEYGHILDYDSDNITADGYVPDAGWENRITIDKYIVADYVSLNFLVSFATAPVIAVGAIDGGYTTSKHATLVKIDFDNGTADFLTGSSSSGGSNIDGKTIPNYTYRSVEMENLNGTEYRVEVGRKNRCPFIRVLNLTTGETCCDEVLTIYETDSSYGAKAGALYDFPVFGTLSGVCCFSRVFCTVSPDYDVVFIGDSITEGSQLAITDVWANKVIASDYVRSGLNCGRGGGNIDNAIRCVQDILPAIRPKIVVVTIGTNGGNTTAKLQLLVDTIKQLGATPIINCVPMLSSGYPATNTTILALNTLHCRLDKATAIGNDTANGQNTDLFFSDRTHPNVAGGIALYNNFMANMGSYIAI